MLAAGPSGRARPGADQQVPPSAFVTRCLYTRPEGACSCEVAAAPGIHVPAPVVRRRSSRRAVGGRPAAGRAHPWRWNQGRGGRWRCVVKDSLARRRPRPPPHNAPGRSSSVPASGGSQATTPSPQNSSHLPPKTSTAIPERSLGRPRRSREREEPKKNEHVVVDVLVSHLLRRPSTMCPRVLRALRAARAPSGRRPHRVSV